MNEIWNLINEMSPYLLLGFGLIIDYLLLVEWFTQSIVQSHACCHE